MSHLLNIYANVTTKSTTCHTVPLPTYCFPHSQTDQSQDQLVLLCHYALRKKVFSLSLHKQFPILKNSHSELLVLHLLFWTADSS